MKIEFDVKLNVWDMFSFQMNHSYRKLIGIIWLIFSALVVGVVIFTWGKIQIYQSILLMVLASLYTILNPIMLFFKSVSQINRTKNLKEPLHYTIDETGVTVSLGEQSETTEWVSMWKAVRYGNTILIYVTNVRVFNIPYRFVKDQYPALVELAGKGLEGRSRLKA